MNEKNKTELDKRLIYFDVTYTERWITQGGSNGINSDSDCVAPHTTTVEVHFAGTHIIVV